MGKQKINITLAEQRTVPIDSVFENPDNPKQITEENFASLVRSLKEDPAFLESSDILVYQVGNTYNVIGGNHRLKVLRQEGEQEVTVTIYDVLTDGQVDEKKLWSAILLHGAHYGRYDLEKLFKGFDKEMLQTIGLPQLNTIIAELDDVKVEKHWDGQAVDDYDFDGWSDTQMIKVYYSREEKAEIEGYFNLYRESEEQKLSGFILNTLRLCGKSHE